MLEDERSPFIAHRSAGARRRHGFRLFAGVAALAVVCVGLTAAASARVTATKPTLTFALYLPCGVDPIEGGFFEHRIVYESLIRHTSQDTLVPALATSWKITPGNKVMTLTLRRGVRFSDGTPFDAAAVKTWFDYRVTKTSGADALLGPVSSVEVLSRYVVRITLKTPNPIFALALSSRPFNDWGGVPSPKAVKAAKADPKSMIFHRQSYGAGPYVYVPSQSVEGDHCTFVPNKYYYDKSKIKWGKIVTRQIADPNTMLAALKTGQVDVGSGQASTKAAAEAAGFKVMWANPVVTAISFLDKGGAIVPALKDVRVRQALNYAVDRKTIAKGLYGPGSIPTSAPNIGTIDPKYKSYYPYNPAKAKALLAAAGYPNGFTFKLLCVGAWLGSLRNDPFCEALAKNLAAIGVKAELDVPADGTVFGQKFITCRCTPAVALPGDPTPTWLAYLQQLKKNGDISDQHGFHDRIIDNLWLKAQRLPDKQAAPLWRQLTTRVITQAYYIPAVSLRFSYYVSKRIGGASSTRGMGFIDPNEWYPTDN